MTQAPILQTKSLTVKVADRVLIQDLTMTLGSEKVALVGRNGVGKTTFLHLLAGVEKPHFGEVQRWGEVLLVPQVLTQAFMSPGERRRELLESAFESGAQLLLLDEPTQDLDQQSVARLRTWLSAWPGGLLVATHDRRVLKEFQHFFQIAESGCRYFSGSFAALEQELEQQFHADQERYLRRLSQLEKTEERTLHLARRRKRKQRYGRVSELDRATPRSRLNEKRSAAQVSHGKINSLREKRLHLAREWTKAARRALKVELPLEASLPTLPPDSGVPIIDARGLSCERGGRLLFRDLDLVFGRKRIAVTGPNGAGKTTLLDILMGKRKPTSGTVASQPSRIGMIEQGGVNWRLDLSLLQYLEAQLEATEVGRHIVSHKFPLALAQRPLRSLSPGERVRAALIGILAQRQPVEMLLLDEPTYGLDLLGQKSLGTLLRAWSGGLLITSHNQDFLDSLSLDKTVILGQTGTRCRD